MKILPVVILVAEADDISSFCLFTLHWVFSGRVQSRRKAPLAFESDTNSFHRSHTQCIPSPYKSSKSSTRAFTGWPPRSTKQTLCTLHLFKLTLHAAHGMEHPNTPVAVRRVMVMPSSLRWKREHTRDRGTPFLRASRSICAISERSAHSVNEFDTHVRPTDASTSLLSKRMLVFDLFFSFFLFKRHPCNQDRLEILHSVDGELVVVDLT